MIYGQIIYVIILYSIAYIYSLVYAPSIATNTTGLNKLHEKCIYGCDMCDSVTGGRGQNYYIAAMDPEKQKNLSKCLLSFWGLTHYILYVLIGYLAPDLFWETFTIGVLFEGYEYIKYDCADPLDPVWNSLGFLTGSYLRKF